MMINGLAATRRNGFLRRGGAAAAAVRRGISRVASIVMRGCGLSAHRGISRVAFTLATAAAMILAYSLPPVAAHDGVDVVSLVRDSRDSVVSVGGIGKEQARGAQREPWGRGAPFDRLFPFTPDFFERFRPRQPEREENRNPPRRTSIGSGFLISSDGYILTNAHVIRPLESIVVVLANGNEYKAEVIGEDVMTDIALLKIEADEKLQPLPIGDSGALQVGQQVLAVGSPFGLDQSATSGIISALGRQLPSERHVPFIQTDAAINPGNSGGPLINAAGEVIGINSQIISPVRAFAGVSFAIPINVAMEVQGRLRADGYISRAYLGISFKPVTALDAEALEMDETVGVLVHEVTEDSPADKAGILGGDVLLAVDEVRIDATVNLPSLIGYRQPGSEVDIELWREQQTLTVTAELGALEVDSATPHWVLGMLVENLDDEFRERTGVMSGVRIADIRFDDDTPAGVRNFRTGDVITHVTLAGRQNAITDKTMFSRLLDSVRGKAASFQIWRSGRRLAITIRI